MTAFGSTIQTCETYGLLGVDRVQQELGAKVKSKFLTSGGNLQHNNIQGNGATGGDIKSRADSQGSGKAQRHLIQEETPR